jgi:hypothetical protein
VDGRDASRATRGEFRITVTRNSFSLTRSASRTAPPDPVPSIPGLEHDHTGIGDSLFDSRALIGTRVPVSGKPVSGFWRRAAAASGRSASPTGSRSCAGSEAALHRSTGL